MHASPLLARHEHAGARLAPRPEAPALVSPLTFGDVPGEYRAGAEGCLLLDAADRGRVRARGAEAVDFLHRITANDVRGLAPGRGNRGLLLSPKGKVRHTFDVLRTTDGIELDAAPGDAAALCAALDQFLFTEDVTLEDASDESAPLELVGPHCDSVAGNALAGDLPSGLHAAADLALEGRPVRATRVPVAGSPGLRLDAGPAGAADLWDALERAGATPGGFFARDALRIEAGAALFGADVDENVYPQEARWEDAFSLTKGCYTGQEVVAKIDTYGGLNKCLVVLGVAGDDPVPRGTPLLREDEDREVGLVTSWSYSFALDRGIVLAYAKRKHQAPGRRFRLGDTGTTATIVAHPVRAHALPPTGAFETA